MCIRDRREEARAHLNGKGREAADAYQKAIDDLVASKAEQAKYIADDNSAMANTASRMLYAAIGLGLLISIALAILLTRNVLGQLGEDPGYMAQVCLLYTSRCV